MRKDWVEVELDEICTIQTGKHDANHSVINGRYRFYTCAFEYLRCDTKKFEGECLILPGNGANVGEVFYYNGEFDAYQRTYVISNINIVPKYLFYFMKGSWKSKNDDKQYGSATNYIRIGNFTNYQVRIAPLPEQRAIVSKIELLFSELDNAVSNLKQAKNKLEIFRQSVLKKAFEGELTKGKITWIELGEVCSNVEYGTSSKSSETGKIPVVRMGNIQNGHIDWNDLVFTSDKEEIEKYSLTKEDVLFNRTNSPEWVGKTAIYKGERPAIFAGYLIRVNYKKEYVCGDYLNYFLNSHTAKQHGNKVKSFGVNQSNINGTKLKKYPFPLCSLKEQIQIVQEIETRFSVADKLVVSIDESLLKAEALRQSILKKAFEGELLSSSELVACRKESDWEPAEKLLGEEVNGI